MIVRGTTPYHSFLVPFARENIDKVYITYLQNEEVILDKDINDVTIEEVNPVVDNTSIDEIDVENIETNEEEEHISQITLHLTQEDTLKFKFYPAAKKNIAIIQLRLLDKNGEAYASDPTNERIFGILKDGVIPSDETNSNTEENAG